ncbi:MAG TPA: PilN domain-containing protein [Rhizomicrobium sp.]|jgi:general secretion pathway protein L|nr:PilN domain-containing protein [Rhizomicrobium sp.]
MSADGSTSDLRSAAAEVFAAWRAELGALFGGVLQGDRDELVVECDGDKTLVLWAGHELGQVAPDAEQAGRALRALLSGVRRRDAVLQLPSGDVLRPAVRLPYASPRVLRSALKYELEKLSPVSPDEVYFDFRILSRDHAENAADIELRIIRRDIVDAKVQLCRSAGLAVAAIRFEGDPREADPASFPVERGASLRSRWRRNNVALAGGGVLALLIALLFVSYMRGSEALDALTDQMADEGIRAARVEQLQSRIEHTTQQLAFLGQQKRSPLFVAILADVSRTLPDGTWINEFDMTGNKIRIEGSSHSASDLIAIFDRSGRFANAQFAAPVTQGSAPGVERFDLTFEIAGAAK